MNDCPECYGKPEYGGKLPGCAKCEYNESCLYFISTAGCDKTSGHVSFEAVSYSKKVAQQSDAGAIFSAVESSGDGQVLQILEFLLDVDNYTAELISAVLHNDCRTTADLGKKFGVSRQAIHRKLQDCCTEHPQLRKLFYTRLYNCRRILTDSDRLTRQRERKQQKKDENQMELF
jgi:hypothetical protein